MKYFYIAMIWAFRFELAIARSTGRDPSNIGYLAERVTYWEDQQVRYYLRGMMS